MNTPFHKRTFRANPAYRIVPFNRLPVSRRRALDTWRTAPDGYGVLEPQAGSKLPVTAVNQDTALLFLTLKEPGRLPDYLTASAPCESEHAVVALVLDRVLEVSGSNGFVSGPEACSVLGINPHPQGGRLASLSYEALRYGQALATSNPETISIKLYLFHRLPASPSWQRRIPDRNAVWQYLRIDSDGTNEALLTRYWRGLQGNDGWLSFASRLFRPSNGGSFCKIYISPQPDALPEIFGTIIETLAVEGAIQFKVGADLFGMLRPDKLVGYFQSKEALLCAAGALDARLKGVPVHGVPFTASAGGDGLISWGVDPRGRSDREGISWRHWVTNRLAAALITARQATDSKVAPWRFALERLRLEGVDPISFAPTAIWTGN